MSQGLTNEAIADRLCLSVRTVERHLTNVYLKLGVTEKLAALRRPPYSSRDTNRGGSPPASPVPAA